MPCSDVTELIRVELDEQDRLTHYRFVKRTCGQGVGADSLILGALQGRGAEDILAMEPDEFLAMHPVEQEIEEFLTLKHLIAVQSALEVLLGKAHGGPGEMCAAAEVGFEDGLTTLDARISVDLVTEKIAACGNCRGCGKNAKPKPRVIFN